MTKLTEQPHYPLAAASVIAAAGSGLQPEAFGPVAESAPPDIQEDEADSVRIDLNVPDILVIPEENGQSYGVRIYTDRCWGCTGWNPHGRFQLERQRCRPVNNAGEKNDLCPANFRDEFKVVSVGLRTRWVADLNAARNSGYPEFLDAQNKFANDDRLTEEDRQHILQKAGLITG